MADVVFVLVSVAFFALCALYIRACERILKGAEESVDTPAEAQQ